jgi:hypothetical protein
VDAAEGYELDDAAGLDTPGPTVAPMSIDGFVNTFRKPLSQPILSSPPRFRITRSARERADEELIPKRSAQLAAKSRFREPKPEVQASKVMMKRLGVEIETQLPDEASFTPSKREAMEVLFPGIKQRDARAS